MTKDKDLYNCGSSEWDESKHPRDSKGQFTYKTVKVDLSADIQKQFDKATPKERSKIAYRYIMDNLRGKYPMSDGRKVIISNVGANKMTHTLYEPKIRALPELKRLIEAGRFIEEKEANHGKFKSFAYFEVRIEVGKEKYKAILNVGIKDNGDSALYDLNQFERQ